jgi:hypothetical protein
MSNFDPPPHPFSFEDDTDERKVMFHLHQFALIVESISTTPQTMHTELQSLFGRSGRFVFSPSSVNFS